MPPSLRLPTWATLVLVAALPTAASTDVDESEVRYVLGPDQIPAIREPTFDDDNSWMRGDDLVLGYSVGADARAYPVKILNWHEIVLDTVAGKPIAATFCPLCGTGIVFDRSVDGQERTFIVSGRLYQSDLVMLDLETRNLWTQLGGRSLGYRMQETSPYGIEPTGAAHESLTVLPAVTSRWDAWVEDYPDTLLLARPTTLSGTFQRNYEQDPYGGYAENRRVGVSGETRQDVFTMHPKEMMHGLVVDGQPIAVRHSALEPRGVANIRIADVALVAVWGGGTAHVYFAEDKAFAAADPGTMTDEVGNVFNASTGRSATTSDLTRTTAVASFWFAWYDFYPQTQVWGALGVRSLTLLKSQGTIAPGEPISLRFTHAVDVGSQGAEGVSTSPQAPLIVAWEKPDLLVLRPASGSWPAGALAILVDGSTSSGLLEGATLGEDVVFRYEVGQRTAPHSPTATESTPALYAVWAVLAMSAAAAARRRRN